MKKLVLTMLAVLVMSMAAAPVAFAATIDVQAAVDDSTGEVTISGAISSGVGKQVTVLVKSPTGNIDYVDQTSSGIDGVYQFRYFVAPDKTGAYSISVGGTDVMAVSEATFIYEGIKDEPGGVTGPGSSIGISVPTAAAIIETAGGVKWTPGASDFVQETRQDGSTVRKISLGRSQWSKALEILKRKDSEVQVVTVDAGDASDAALEVPAEVLAELNASGIEIVISLETAYGQYHLPLQALSGKVPPGAAIVLAVSKATAEINSEIAQQLGHAALTEALEFSIWSQMNGAINPINDFGNTYVSRGITMQGTVDANRATGVLYDPLAKSLSFVPTVFVDQDGQTTALIKRNGNSFYTVVQLEKSFEDITNSWAKADIELLASKLIVQGQSETFFAPGAQVTRAEFAAMLIRALGLVNADAEPRFKDVSRAAWYSGAIASAAQYGLVGGYADDTFKPERNITREEMAVMIVRALAFAGHTSNSPAIGSQLAEKFADSDAISLWAMDAVAAAAEANIITGATTDRFVPKRNATRAEAAVMLKRLLQHLEFINN